MGIGAGDWPAWVAVAISLGGAWSGWRDRKRRRQLDEEASQVARRIAEATEQRARAAEDRAAAIERLVAEQSHRGRVDRPIGPTQAQHAAETGVRWAVEHVRGSMWALRNTGDTTATGVSIDREQLPQIVRYVPENAVVPAGASVEWMMAASWGSSIPHEVWVSWTGHPEPMAVPVPNQRRG